ncbi:MAG TPA: homoserine O-succinyltransferase [Xanthobacteraceae bacterium]|jgi:homoserine O-succinyltransferase|nr:homoserine O-succinyltransferase [Xanthobacteraceae bacterium]
MALFMDTRRTAPVALNAPNCVTIGLVNNMPDSAVEATERQFTNLVRVASSNIIVVLRLFAIPEVPRAPTMRATMAERYRDIAELWDAPLDGLIVTGTEPRATNLAEEPYWDNLTTLVDWAREHTSSTIWSCLAAHAAVLHADGIERRPLKEKRSGVFDCHLAMPHPMTEHFPAPLRVPHSRYNDLSEAELAASGYHILTRSLEAGVDAFVKQDGSFFLFFQGHPEYDADTLLREYRRDAVRFLSGERQSYPPTPADYFTAEGLEIAEAFAALARAKQSGELAASFPKDVLEASLKREPGLAEGGLAERGLAEPWRAAAVGVYQKWVAYLVARKAERRMANVPLRRIWRDWPKSLRSPDDLSAR